MPQPAGPHDAEAFVGRSHELAVLSAALRQATTGDARLALMSGEPGIGKPGLARAFARAARSDGALVLRGSAWEEGGAPPYWPWVQVLRSYGRQAGAAALADAAGPQAAVLGQLLPELGPARDPAGSGPGARLTLFEAVCTVLDQASRAAPLAVIFDDLHAAGRPWALLLRFAAARLSRVLLLATYRTAEAALDPDVSDVIATLKSASPPPALAGLSAGDVRLMLPGADADVLAVVQRRSEGNPLFVSQVARLLGPGAATVEEVPVPAGIRQAVRRQVAWLADAKAATGDNTPGAEEILATAAALGPGIDPALVAAALGIPAGPVARLCDDATAIGLLIRHPGRDLAALDLVQLAAATGPAAAAAEDGLHDASGAGADEVLDQQARTAYRQRLTTLDEDLAEAEAWHDIERASRLRAEKDFLVRELAAATGLGGRPRRLGAESERARLNVTRAIRSAIARIRDRAPAAAAHLDQSIRTGTRCSYSPPNG
jgi:hypothetical protein